MKFSDSVVYCDNHILVVVKQAGMSTQPHSKGEENLEDLAKAWIKEAFQKPGRVFLHPVHRLDKAVRGLVLFARTSKALSRLQKMMRERKIKKIYVAKVEGVLQHKEGTLTHQLVHRSHRAEVSPDGKASQLDYKVLSEQSGYSVIEVTLVTGRYHQIRVQLAEIGHPIIGDIKYGSKTPFKPGEIALCHAKMALTHPVTGEVLSFECPGYDE